MNCNELDNHLHDFLDQRLDRHLRTEVANHLASCRRCAVRVAEFEQADRHLRALKAVEPPPDFLAAVRRKIAEQTAPAEAPAAAEPGLPAAPVGESFRAWWRRKVAVPLWVQLPIGAAAVLVLVFAIATQFESQRTISEAEFPLPRIEPAPREPLAPPSKEADATVRLEFTTEQGAEAVPGAATAPVPPPPSARAAEQRFRASALPPSAPGAPSEAAFLPSRADAGERLSPTEAKSPTETAGTTVTAMMAEATEAPPAEGFAGSATNREAEARLVDSAPLRSAAAAAGGETGRDELALARPPAAPRLSAPSREARPAVPSRTAPLAKAEVLPLTNARPSLQAGWLDLGTLAFYVEFVEPLAGAAFVRGYLDENNRFVVTSPQVEGRVVEMDPRAAATNGTYGWLTLGTREFKPARPGWKPSYPCIEGYRDRQGGFHPISRKIHRATD